jgi:5'(3')-deoxyribonucleotidase
MRVALDMDSVVAETTEAMIVWMKEKHNVVFKKSDVTDWDWVQHKYDLSTPEVVKMFAEIWGERWESVPPTEPDIEKKVLKLADLSEVTIVTSASPEQMVGKLKWLYKYDLKNIPVLVVPYGKTKESLPYHIFVDDRDDTIERVSKAGKIGVLYDQPWNQTCKVGFRVKSLNGVISFLQGKGVQNGQAN